MGLSLEQSALSMDEPLEGLADLLEGDEPEPRVPEESGETDAQPKTGWFRNLLQR